MHLVLVFIPLNRLFSGVEDVGVFHETLNYGNLPLKLLQLALLG